MNAKDKIKEINYLRLNLKNKLVALANRQQQIIKGAAKDLDLEKIAQLKQEMMQ